MASRDIIKHVESFNNKLKILSKSLIKKHANDEKVARAHKRMITIIALDPVKAIDKIGPYLYKYRDQIYNLHADGGELFFLDTNIDDDIKADDDSHDQLDLLDYILPRIKENIYELPDQDKTECKTMIIEMLDNYLEYLSATRGIN